ncbi:MAG: hypothetical protein KDC90_16140, partial [Ignavibacteriae bacterium]|nr:hypothetical protein [Ignavibacteriota bacterium]
ELKVTSITLSPRKKKIFWVITFLFPILLFLILELSLRVLNYGGNLDLFIDGPVGYEEYKRCNPNVARRYFSSEESVPTPPLQLFLKNKPQNGKRIFVLGGSSAAGFPYSNNLSFPKLLESRLALAYPKNNIEVINVAMAAINSYSLLDMVDEVLEESPDAVLIYAGHNEFYGALGVGSVQSLGSWRGLIRTYLKLHKVKSFLMIKDFIIWIKTQIGETLIDTKEGNQSSTLMARIVSEQTIPLDSDLYSKGKEQYLENMELILGKIKEKNIPVLIGELVSNIKDQKPFVSVKDEAEQSAESFFKSAKIAEEENDFISAKENYLKAKDFDALRFRSTEEFNEILHSLSDTYDVPIVPLLKYFTNASQNGIYGNNLFLEHLHPNKEGYNLISKAFFEALQINNTIKFDSVSSEKINFDKIPGYTDLDSVYASLVIKHLKGGWPFKSKNTANMFFQNFKPQNKLEEISFKIMIEKNYNLESGHMELGEYFESIRNPEAAYSEYSALIHSIPYEILFYEKAAKVLLEQKKYEMAVQLLLKANNFKKSDFAYKWLGQIALMNKNFNVAIKYLLEANHNDDQVLFNLSRSFYYINKKAEGDKYFTMLTQNHPKSKYTSYLLKLRALQK